MRSMSGLLVPLLVLSVCFPVRAQLYCGSPLVAGGTQTLGNGACQCQFSSLYIQPCDGGPPAGDVGLCNYSHSALPGQDPGCTTICGDGWGLAKCTGAHVTTPCGATACAAVFPEQCDGADNDSDGRIDAGACGEGGPCQNYRTDPVHVGSGAYLTHPAVDVRFEGAHNPIEFVRTFTSMDGWPPRFEEARERARLGQGWFHTFDQSLYSATGYGAPNPIGTAGTVYIHRTARGAGRRFLCNGNPSTGGACRSNDGSLDTLSYDPTSETWRIDSGSGARTNFDAQGELHSHGWFGTSGTLIDGWTVGRYSGGALRGRIYSVTDHLGRTLYFIWQTIEGMDRLVRLEDASGVVLASYAPLTGAHALLLQSASSAAGTEAYGYSTVTFAPGRTATLPHLTSVVRAGATVVTVTYDDTPT
ncbi:MAG: DUF6531 domain-containing protein, partial [Sandaracinaceae bacterium]|nr:DUF6531 domain-containing protein [Sandaracinaceae bacterium]